MSAVTSSGLSGRRVLVTGGSGFIGRHMVAELTADGAEVRVIDLKAHPDPTVDLVQGDLADADVLAEALRGGIDAVVHLAAVTSVLRSIEQPELTYRTNVQATHGLLEGARKAGVKALAFASTNAVTGPMDAPAITEQATLKPLTPYGATKAAGEMLMSAYTASYGVRCACLRLTNVYGLGMQAKDSIVARLMRVIRLGGDFEIYGDGTQVRDYVNAADVASAFRLALTSEDWTGPGRHRRRAVAVRPGRARCRPRGDRRIVRGPPWPGQAGRDARGDRRPRGGAREGMGAEIHL